MFTALVTASASGLVAFQILKSASARKNANQGAYEGVYDDAAMMLRAEEGSAPAVEPAEVLSSSTLVRAAPGGVSGLPLPAMRAPAPCGVPAPYNSRSKQRGYSIHRAKLNASRPMGGTVYNSGIAPGHTMNEGMPFVDRYTGETVQFKSMLPPPATGSYASGSGRRSDRGGYEALRGGSAVDRPYGSRVEMPSSNLLWTAQMPPNMALPDTRKMARQRGAGVFDNGVMNDALPPGRRVYGEKPAGYVGYHLMNKSVGAAPSNARGYMVPTTRGLVEDGGAGGIANSERRDGRVGSAMLMSRDKSDAAGVGISKIQEGVGMESDDIRAYKHTEFLAQSRTKRHDLLRDNTAGSAQKVPALTVPQKQITRLGRSSARKKELMAVIGAGRRVAKRHDTKDSESKEGAFKRNARSLRGTLDVVRQDLPSGCMVRPHAVAGRATNLTQRQEKMKLRVLRKLEEQMRKERVDAPTPGVGTGVVDEPKRKCSAPRTLRGTKEVMRTTNGGIDTPGGMRSALLTTGNVSDYGTNVSHGTLESLGRGVTASMVPKNTKINATMHVDYVRPSERQSGGDAHTTPVKSTFSARTEEFSRPVTA